MSNFKKQYIAKGPILYRNVLQHNFDELEHNSIGQRVRLHAARNKEFGSEFNNPILILPKGHAYILFNDARL